MAQSINFKIGTYLAQSINDGVIESDGGFSEAGVTASGGGGSSLTIYETLDSLPASGFSSGDQAYVKGNNRFYINNGSGWYNVTLINAAPFWDSAPQAAYTIEDSNTPLTVTGLALDSDNPSSFISYTGFASDSGQYLVNITTDSSITTFTPLSADSVANNATLGNIPDSSGGDFTYTFRATDGISVVTQVSTITYQPGGAGTSSLLWRYVITTNSNNSPPLIDLDPDADHGFYTSDGGTEILSNHSHGALNPGTSDTYAWFTNGTDPLTGSRVTSFAAGSSTDSFFNSSGSGGARVAFGGSANPSQVGDFVAIGFATATDITTLGHINLRTLSSDRPNRVPVQAKLQYYTGDVNSTYNVSLWADYATLDKVTAYGTYEWTNITSGSSITGVQG